MMFFEILWRALGKAALKHPVVVGGVACWVIMTVILSALGLIAIDMIHPVGIILASSFVSAIIATLLANLVFLDFLETIASKWEETEEEIIAEQVAPESPTKGGMTEIKE